MYVLYDVGERNISRAKSKILENGLGGIIINKGNAGIFITLKLACKDWGKITKNFSDELEPETKELIEMLRKPYGFFYDYSAPWSVDPFKKICEEEGLDLPGKDDV